MEIVFLSFEYTIQKVKRVHLIPYKPVDVNCDSMFSLNLVLPWVFIIALFLLLSVFSSSPFMMCLISHSLFLFIFWLMYKNISLYILFCPSFESSAIKLFRSFFLYFLSFFCSFGVNTKKKNEKQIELGLSAHLMYIIYNVWHILSLLYINRKHSFWPMASVYECVCEFCCFFFVVCAAMSPPIFTVILYDKMTIQPNAYGYVCARQSMRLFRYMTFDLFGFQFVEESHSILSAFIVPYEVFSLLAAAVVAVAFLILVFRLSVVSSVSSFTPSKKRVVSVSIILSNTYIIHCRC